MEFKKELSSETQRAANNFPALVLTGARQAGKATLLRRAFPSHNYVSLDLPSTAESAESEPEAFLERHPAPLLVDEVQYAPRLFRWLKVRIGRDRHLMGQRFTRGGGLPSERTL